MNSGTARTVEVPVEEDRVGVPSLPGLLLLPEDASALLVLAHGAGTGMAHPVMEGLAAELADRGVGSLRFSFPFSALGRKRPDPEERLRASVRGAVVAAGGIAVEAGGLRVVAGGRSMGGRMTLIEAADGGLSGLGVEGLLLFNFPLHAPGRPAVDRGEWLRRTDLPVLLLQGDRDTMAELPLLESVVDHLGSRVTLHLEVGADHGFQPPKRSGRSREEVLSSVAERAARWIRGLE